MGWRSRTCASIAALVLVLIAIPAVAATKQRPQPMVKNCHGKTAHRTAGKWRCEKPFKLTSRDRADGGLSRAQKALASAKLRTRNGRKVSAKLARVRGLGLSGRMLPTLLKASKRASGAQVRRGAPNSHAADTQTTTVDGARTTSTYGPGPELPDGWTGGGSDIDVETTKQVDGSDVTAGQSSRYASSVARCPDSQGVVPGKIDQLFGLTMGSFRRGVGGVKARHEVLSRGSLEVHVGDDGVIRDFDVDMTMRVHIQVVVLDGAGRVVQTNSPAVFTFSFAQKGLKLYQGSRLPIKSVKGPGNAIVRSSDTFLLNTDEAEQAYNAVNMQLPDLSRRVNVLLLGAQHDWQDGGCLQIQATPEKYELAAGDQSLVTATVTPKPSAKGLAHGTLTVTTGNGTLTPSQSSYTNVGVPLNFRAPDEKGWKTARLTLKVVSRQGGAEQELVLSEKKQPELPHFRVLALGGRYEMTYSYSQTGPTYTTTGSQQYDISLNSNADRDATDGSVSDTYGIVHLPMLLNGVEDYSFVGNAPVNGVSNPCHGLIQHQPRSLDFLSISREPGAATAEVSFGALGPAYASPSCLMAFHDGGETPYRDHPWMVSTVPWSTITGTQPFTVSVQDEFTDPNHTVKRARSVTLQPVDATGAPLG